MESIEEYRFGRDDISFENEEEMSQILLDQTYEKNNESFCRAFFDIFGSKEIIDEDKVIFSSDNFEKNLNEKDEENKCIINNNLSTKTNTKTKPLIKKLEKIFEFTKINKKLGRIKKDTNYRIVGKHDKFAEDNIIQKIKVNFHEHIYNYINIEYEKFLESINEPNDGNIIKLIRRISPKVFKKISKEDNLKWFSSKLKDVFSTEISSKYNKYDRNYNKRQIESLYRENKAKNVINILEKNVRDMYHIYCNNIPLEGFKTLNDGLDELREKMERNGVEKQNIQNYMEKYKEICCDLENIFLKKTARKRIGKKK